MNTNFGISGDIIHTTFDELKQILSNSPHWDYWEPDDWDHFVLENNKLELIFDSMTYHEQIQKWNFNIAGGYDGTKLETETFLNNLIAALNTRNLAYSFEYDDLDDPAGTTYYIKHPDFHKLP